MNSEILHAHPDSINNFSELDGGLNEQVEEKEVRAFDTLLFNSIDKYAEDLWKNLDVPTAFDILRQPGVVDILQQVAGFSDIERHEFFAHNTNYARLSPLFDFVSMVNPNSDQPVYPELFRLIFGENREKSAQGFYGSVIENTSLGSEEVSNVPYRSEIIHATNLLFPSLTSETLKDDVSIQKVIDSFNEENINTPFHLVSFQKMGNEVLFSIVAETPGQESRYMYRVDVDNPYNTNLEWENPNGEIQEIQSTIEESALSAQKEISTQENGDILPEIPAPSFTPYLAQSRYEV